MQNLSYRGTVASFFKHSLVVTTALAGLTFIPALAANVPLLTGPAGSNPAQFPADLPDINNTVNAINSGGANGINPNTMGQFATPRNYLDNGAMFVAQRGLTTLNASGTAGCLGKDPVGGYISDRWCVNVNVSAQAGKGQVITSGPTPPLGFSRSLAVTRDSGALTQQVCAIQEILTADALTMQGQQVVFSAYIAALGGLSADNGNLVKMQVIYGTGSDEGLASLTSSPAITPAWTGINSSITSTKTVTTGFVRYTVAGTIPSTATEAGVEICFNPQTGSGGATDGFAFTGAQMEVGTTPSTYEFRPLALETSKAQTYFIRFAESVATQNLVGLSGIMTSSLQCNGSIPFPVAMRAAPTYTNQLSGTTFAMVGTDISTFSSPVALGTPFSAPSTSANLVTDGNLKLTIANTALVKPGDYCSIISVNGSGKMDFSADF